MSKTCGECKYLKLKIEDKVAMLEELKTEIEELPMYYDPLDVRDLIQQKINALKELEEGLTRKQVIANLQHAKKWHECPTDESLDYAISSLKTDEAYQIMYEGGEIFTKDEIKILSTDEAAQIVGMRTIESTCYWASFFKELKDAGLSICKINTIKEQEDGKV